MANSISVAVLTHAGGAHVESYLQGLAASEACARVHLADPDGKWEAPARKILGAKVARVEQDYRQLLAEAHPEMALISMEARLAPPVINAALNAGCHVLCEKPSCVRVEDFVPLVDKADRTHRHLMLALANRSSPEIVEAKRLVASGLLGRLYGLEMHLIADQARLNKPDYHQSWYADKRRAGGGHLIWLGIHWLDLAMFIADSSIVDVLGFTALIGGQPIEIEDSAVAALRFENGMLGTITSGYYLDKGYHSHIKLWGSAGWLQLEPTGDMPLTWYTTQGEKAGSVQTLPGPKPARGYTPFVDSAVTACANMTAPPISNAESLRALKTVFAIYRSDSSGQAVQAN